MSRPVDWAPLATSDPVPGDPVQVSAIGRRHAELAEELRAQAANLRTLASSQGWDADAGRLFTASAGQVADQLEGAQRRYTAVAEALTGYAPYLDQAQREADAALQQAKAAQSTIDANQTTSPPTTLGPGLDPQPLDDPVEAARRARALDSAHGDLGLARQRMRSAEDLRTTQARRAANHIGDVTAHDGLTDSWWDKVKDWTSQQWDGLMAWTHKHAESLKQFAKVCGWISSALSVIALVLAFTPLAPLAPIFDMAGDIFTGLALGCHLLLAMSGDGSWVDVGLEVVALLSGGYSRFAAKGMKAGQRALELTATRAARKAAERTARQTARALGKIPRPGTKAAQIAARAIRRQATEAAKIAVEDASRIPGSQIPKYLLTLDAHAAKALAEAKGLARLAGTPRADAEAAVVRAAATKVIIAEWVKHIAENLHVPEPSEPARTFHRYGAR